MSSPSRPESDSTPVARFAIQAWAEADVLPRLLAPLVKRGLVPLRFDAAREGDDLRVHVELAGMAGAEALRLAAAFRQIVNVRSVVSAVDGEGAEAAPAVPAGALRAAQGEASA